VYYFKQFYLGCLAHASYLIGSDGEAAVVDPQRDVDQYIDEAARQGLRIKYVVETHLHADFVSGHHELAERTGAQIVFGSKAGVTFDHVDVHDGDLLKIGKINLKVLETPGHTPESVSLLLSDPDEPRKPMKVLTGDTLFIGDVGRPDLAGGKGFSAEQMAGMLYDSLRGKLLALPDETEVYPAHGAGSMCGRNISKDTSSSIGQQRQFNYALKPMSKEEFVKMMTTDLPEAPTYFSQDAEMNRTGAAVLKELEPPSEMNPAEFKQLASTSHLVLDVRPAAQFGNGHVPGALNIALGGQFASWAGTLIKRDTPILLVAEDREGIDEAVQRLARVGIESVKGFLGGGMYAWDKAGGAVASVAQMPVDELRHQIEEKPELQLLDVRRPAEYNGGHAPGFANVPLQHLEEEMAKFDPTRPIAVMCQGGYRSSAGTSILAKHGFHQVFNVVGGFTAWNNLTSDSGASATANAPTHG
jgi:glyoxylase-like metal-dependent hydrolase (beta-lactamase superfamily II)/rhodanese-related sulfurtransferase